MAQDATPTARWPSTTCSLEAPSGQITVFVGPSGCGKTTSLRMINRMIEPTSRPDLLDDRDTATFNKAELRRGIGYVIQHAGPVPAPHGRRQRRDRAAAARHGQEAGPRAARWSCSSGSACRPSFAKRYPAQLSGGQQQRVGVARALAADPPVMLMDEPFSAVDPVVREQLQDEFLRLQGELGKTIVFVTHDIDEAIKLGDQVAVLRVGGNLAQLATPAELLSSPADDFVAGFVGRDRGYRALGFADAGPRLPLDRRADGRGSGSTLQRGRATSRSDGWVLVVDDARVRRRAGWPSPVMTRRGPRRRSSRRLLNRGGTLATHRRHVAWALDAALSSPSGRGVVVDEDGSAGRHRSPRRECSSSHRGHGQPAQRQPARRSDGPGQVRERPRERSLAGVGRRLVALALLGLLQRPPHRRPQLALGRTSGSRRCRS